MTKLKLYYQQDDTSGCHQDLSYPLPSPLNALQPASLQSPSTPVIASTGPTLEPLSPQTSSYSFQLGPPCGHSIASKGPTKETMCRPSSIQLGALRGHSSPVIASTGSTMVLLLPQSCFSSLQSQRKEMRHASPMMSSNKRRRTKWYVFIHVLIIATFVDTFFTISAMSLMCISPS